MNKADVEAVIRRKSSHLASYLALLVFLVAGCATTEFTDYSPKGTLYPIGKGPPVQLGEIQNNLGLGDPKKIRYNVTLDRPLVEAVREAFTSELQAAGFAIGPGNFVVSVAINSSDRTSAVLERGLLLESDWTFRVYRAADNQVLFTKKYTCRG